MGVPERLARAVEELGGRAEVDQEGRLVLRFSRRGFSLSDLPREALEEAAGYPVIVIVEEGYGEGGVGYYYYVYPEEVRKLLSRGEAGSPGSTP